MLQVANSPGGQQSIQTFADTINCSQPTYLFNVTLLSWLVHQHTHKTTLRARKSHAYRHQGSPQANMYLRKTTFNFFTLYRWTKTCHCPLLFSDETRGMSLLHLFLFQFVSIVWAPGTERKCCPKTQDDNSCQKQLAKGKRVDHILLQFFLQFLR